MAETLEQVMGDDAKPMAERLAYARRLVRLDPESNDCQRLLNGLLGKDEQPPAPKPVAKHKRKAKAKPKAD